MTTEFLWAAAVGLLALMFAVIYFGAWLADRAMKWADRRDAERQQRNDTAYAQFKQRRDWRV